MDLQLTMHKKIVALVALFGLVVAALVANAPNLFMPAVANPDPRTVEFFWYDFFDTELDTESWEYMERVNSTEVLSWEYPVVYTWTWVKGYPQLKLPAEEAPLHNSLYTSARLNVTGRNLPEINIDNIGGVNSPEYPDGQVAGFLPYDLMGGLQQGVQGGTAEISLYMAYINKTRAIELEVSGFFWGWFACENEMYINITLDRSAAKKVLGITNQQYNNIESWWADNREAVEWEWRWWLYEEGGMRPKWTGRRTVRAYYDDNFLVYYIDLPLTYDEATDTVTIDMHLVNYAGDCLLGKWFSETFMRGYEGSYDDLSLNMTIGPTTTDIDLDTGVDYALCSWEGRWAFEAFLGDYPGLTYEYKLWDSPAAAYIDKMQYYGYDGQHETWEYDYTPAAWDLQEGETMTLWYKDIQDKGPVFIINPNGQEKWGYLYEWWIEPEVGDYPNGGEIEYEWGEYVRFTGPLDMTAWSKDYYNSFWMKLADEENPEGLLPWGAPYVEFSVGNPGKGTTGHGVMP